MKIKTISRNEEKYTRENNQDLLKVHHNKDPALHPFEKAREYTRALNATKLERVFAKPFVGDLAGHMDGVQCLEKNPKSLTCVVSGACDGEVRVWDLRLRKVGWSVFAHRGFIRGLTVTPDGKRFLSCGADKKVKHFKIKQANPEAVEPITTYLGKFGFNGIDHHWTKPHFVTCGPQHVELWDETRTDPLHSFSWGVDSVLTVKYNPVERDLFASAASDRNIVLYDTRSSTPVQKVILNMKSNAIAWNPMEAFNFIVANEDHNIYQFDMRKLHMATNVHKDHVSAVMDVDFSPTGQSFVSGSYDRTVRMFKYNGGRSYEVYHTKRMQRVFSVRWTMDNEYLLSGSDDTNIRIWKSQAHKQSGVLLPREREKQEYQEKLKERFKDVPEIKRIARHRQLPRGIYKASKLKTTIREARKKKEKNLRAHSAPGKVPFKAERKKHIVKTEE